MKIPDYFEPITAYRAFDVYPNGLLVGQAHAEPWPTYAPFVARCGFVHPDGFAQHLDDAGAFQEAPVFKCDCGIHALKTEAALIERRDKDWAAHASPWPTFLNWDSHYRPSARAWGPVKIWGRVVEHEVGYRAQFAYPADLTCDDKQIAPKIAALYGVPCGFEAKPQPKPREDDPSYWFAASAFPPFAASPYVAPVKPAYVPPPTRTIPAPVVVGASKWEIKQYGQLKDGPKVDVPEDWKAILRKMVHLNPLPTAKKLEALTVDILQGVGYQMGATVKIKTPRAMIRASVERGARSGRRCP